MKANVVIFFDIIYDKNNEHSLLKISTTNSLMNHELKCVLMTRIITIAGIRDIQFQFRWQLESIGVIASPIRYQCH